MRVAFVTGGTRGIGRAIVKRLHQSGYRVIFFGRNEKNAQDLVETLGDDRCRFVKADLSSVDIATAAFADAIAAEGAIHVLVNNAGTGEPRGEAVRDYDPKDVERVLSVNLHVPIQLCRLAWRSMKELKADDGCIINISSIGSSFNADHAQYIPLYSTTKAGMDQFTRAIAVPALQDGVRVYTVNPGVVDTDMGHGVVNSRFPHDTLDGFADGYNIDGRPALPSDIAELVNELCIGETRHRPGDALACFADAETINMSALSSHMHNSSLTQAAAHDSTPISGGVKRDADNAANAFHPRTLLEKARQPHDTKE